ncbi:FAD-dependent oxidoreductase [Mycobacterium sp. 236(2023)]|uniref:NAD(P)/FAD-dependent oxidoreductase n=1 Tax=Mycobacterium sp. 236(2023) TaxID=3038163 RepID=UPI002414E863|nr:FAD-dependent oxidoreductase [Mycobacterium sp. 236(2023)]MDG4663007.1 FAD-dependent oxidoreductase [Mycobacterium sp. 236(2023)]
MVATSSFDVLVIGGGNAGLSTAAHLLRRGINDIAVIEPLAVHTYRPLLSYVGGGQASIGEAERTQRSVTPRGCSWVQDSVTAVDAVAHTVSCASGRTYGYRDLVLSPGLVPDTDALPGLAEVIESPAVCSNYLDRAEDTWQLVRAMPPRHGHAVFTVPRAPVSCTGTTIKPLFLAADYWRRQGRLGDVDITLVIDRPALLGVPDVDDRLRSALAELGARVCYDTSVSAVRPDDRKLVVEGPDGTRTLPFDLLHLVPPFRGPRWLEDAGLSGTDSHGRIDIDPETLQHRVYSTVWAAGDAAQVATDPSGGALRRQTSTLADNLVAARNGRPLSRYDGYTVAPVATDSRHLIPAEFDRDGAISSSLPSFLDPLKPRRVAWAFDRYVLPQIYWNLILKGRA